MKTIQHLITLLLVITLTGACANDTVVDPPLEKITYSNPVQITINGYTIDAMEPFISPDGNTLFFNSINDGNNTKIYYATKVNNTTFTFEGELDGANESKAAQLNAVADLDALNNFYWTSVRDYPAKPIISITVFIPMVRCTTWGEYKVIFIIYNPDGW